ncbi:MAG: BrnA antitoxin family protein [Terriglobia bacterium]
MDRQVLDWFKAKGPGDQTRINALLRRYMEATRDEAEATSCPSCSQRPHNQPVLPPYAQ